jgi:hypothetical protein
MKISVPNGMALGHQHQQQQQQQQLATAPLPTDTSKRVAPRAFGRLVTFAFELTPSEVFAMLKFEDELRLSKETQDEFKRWRLEGKGEEGMSVVVEDIQRRVAREFGLSEEVGMEALRCAETLLGPEHRDTVVKLSLYRRHNRCVDGSLRVGDLAPLHPLLHPVSLVAQNLASSLRVDMCDPPAVCIGDFLTPGSPPLVLVCGSYT